MLFFTFESKKTTVKYRKSFLRCSRHRGIDIKRWICSIGAIVEGKGFYAAIIVGDKILPSGLLLSFHSHPVATTRRRFRLITTPSAAALWCSAPRSNYGTMQNNSYFAFRVWRCNGRKYFSYLQILIKKSFDCELTPGYDIPCQKTAVSQQEPLFGK